MNHYPLLPAGLIREWDAFTIRHQKISSLDLMERAAMACFHLLSSRGYFLRSRSFTIFCGKGNNGGDGLALARILSMEGYQATVYILEFGHPGTADFQENLMRLHKTAATILFIQNEEQFHPLSSNDIVIDALFGSGLGRPLDGIAGKLVQHINSFQKEIVSIDIPSGMYADNNSSGNEIIKATLTISFQAWKLAFLMPENAPYIGNLQIENIQLEPVFLEGLATPYELVTPSLIKSIYKPRAKFSHKGTFGHAAIFAGNVTMMGAALLAVKACMRSGVGKLTCLLPVAQFPLINNAVPECITSEAETEGKFDAIGIGPGMSTSEDLSVIARIKELFKQHQRIVIDAGMLNLLSLHPSLLQDLPPFSILTPHPKEFERLFGPSANNFERIEKAIQKARELNVIIILKGHYSFVAMPGGKAYFNTTGNPGMATAGSGDVLTGILTGLLAQPYTQEETALLGVYLHGLAGDLAASFLSQEALIASDIVNYLGAAFKNIG